MMGIRPLIASTPGVGSPDTSDRYPFRFSFWDNRALAAVHGIDTGGRRPFVSEWVRFPLYLELKKIRMPYPTLFFELFKSINSFVIK